jgi:hypothetical protein
MWRPALPGECRAVRVRQRQQEASSTALSANVTPASANACNSNHNVRGACCRSRAVAIRLRIDQSTARNCTTRDTSTDAIAASQPGK